MGNTPSHRCGTLSSYEEGTTTRSPHHGPQISPIVIDEIYTEPISVDNATPTVKNQASDDTDHDTADITENGTSATRCNDSSARALDATIYDIPFFDIDTGLFPETPDNNKIEEVNNTNICEFKPNETISGTSVVFPKDGGKSAFSPRTEFERDGNAARPRSSTSTIKVPPKSDPKSSSRSAPTGSMGYGSMARINQLAMPKVHHDPNARNVREVPKKKSSSKGRRLF